MADHLSELAKLRILVAHLGEAAEKPWWPTQFTTHAGLTFSRQNFPRTWASAAINGAVHAAQAIHDERIGKQGTRHLFRFDGGLEREVHSEILHGDQEEIARLVADRETALENIRALVRQTVSAAPGPVQVGTLGTEDDPEILSDIAAHYLDAFERGEQIFPYLAGGGS
jgi:hypothetical protein